MAFFVKCVAIEGEIIIKNNHHLCSRAKFILTMSIKNAPQVI